MGKILSNFDKTIFLCIVSHKEVDRLLLKNPITEISPKSVSKKQILRAAAKQRAVQYMLQMAEYRGFAEGSVISSVSHSMDTTVLLASYCPNVFSCGVDIETLDLSRHVRPFMLNYLARSNLAMECSASPLLQSTIMFCCMESIYKTISALWPITFSVDDYRLDKISSGICTFKYIGVHNEIPRGLMRCRYYLYGNTVISTTFMNFQLISI